MPITCHSCKIETEKPESFVKSRHSFRSKEVHYCPTCWSREKVKEHSLSLWIVVVLGVIGIAFAWLFPEKRIGWVLGNILLFQLFSIVAILPHELGHAAVARWTGFYTHKILIGMGKAVWKGKLFGLDTEIGLVPAGGFACVSPRQLRGYRRKMFAIVLAGPAVNLLLLLLVLPFVEANKLWTFSTFDQSFASGIMFFYANLWILVASLLPYSFKHPNGRFPNDGKLILSLPFMKPEAISEAHANYFALRAGEYHAKGNLKESREWFDRGLALYPENSNLLVGKGLQLLQDNEFVPAREVFRTLLEQSSANRAFRPVLLNNVAYTNLMIADPLLLDEADRFSKEAISTLGMMPAIKGTRGAVLVELGRLDEGMPLLQAAAQEHESPINKASNCCWMAIAEAKRGNLPEAEKYLAEARQLYPTGETLARAERVLADAGKHRSPC